MNNFQSNNLLHLKLISQGMDGLYEILNKLVGLTLNKRFVLQKPYFVGGQSILWLTHDLKNKRKLLLTKMALLPYHRPAYLKAKMIQRVRQRIEREADLLNKFSNSILPKSYGLYYAPNPLHALERGIEITDNEPYLVLEFIEGATLAEVIRDYSSNNNYLDVSLKLAITVLETISQFSDLIFENGGYLYTDFNPRNLIVTSINNLEIRIIDAVSIIPSEPNPTIDIPFSWEFIPPAYYEAYDSGHYLWATKNSVMYSMGVLAWQIRTGQTPIPKQTPNVDELPQVYDVDKYLADLISNLLHGKYSFFSELNIAVQELKKI